MPFQEDFSEFLDIAQGFAIDATIVMSETGEHIVRGIFSREYIDIDSGMAGISCYNPSFECIEDDIDGVSYDDFLIVSGKSYRIKEIKPDGTGWVILVLQEE